MDQAAYSASQTSALSTLLVLWVSYCTQPDEELLRRFNHLQLQVEVAAVHAQELNYAAAVQALPSLTLTYVSPPWQLY